MVRRLADALEVPSREQNALLEAAGLRPTFPHRPLDDRDVARYRVLVDALLRGHEPLPAAVVDRYGAVHRANDAFERLMPGMIGVPPETLVDNLFGPGPFREIVVNFDEVAASWLARQRHEADRTGDPRLEALLDRAQRLIDPLPRREFNDEAVVCSRLRIGDQVLALYTSRCASTPQLTSPSTSCVSNCSTPPTRLRNASSSSTGSSGYRRARHGSVCGLPVHARYDDPCGAKHRSAEQACGRHPRTHRRRVPAATVRRERTPHVVDA